MTTFQTDSEIVLFSKKFGLITEKQIILTNGTSQNKVNFDSINRINLIKKRVFYINTILLVASLILYTYIYFSIKYHPKEFLIGLALLGTLMLVYSLIYKFYNYKLIIKEKDNSIIEVKTSQLHRKCIKEFYNAIIKKIPKNKK
ncbi:hypothetical protein [Flavobacterium sp.]|uniref:hypothetical protein n=1 Tax=Flavobacterium sp. TaxID=239 RepID=UPI0026308B27|nr:hypothetical protein [Flavobacterium sp.]